MRFRLLWGIGVAFVILLVLCLTPVWQKRRAAAAGPSQPQADFSVSGASAVSNVTPPRLWAKATPSGVNAADLYKQAIGLYEGLTDAQKEMLKGKFDPKMDPKEAAALFKEIQPIMDLLRQARKAGYSDWGMGAARFDSPMPQMTKGMQLGNLALWEAGYRFQTDPDGAVGDLAARDALGQSLNNSLIGMVVENAFNLSALQMIAQNAGSISNAASADLAFLTNSAEATSAFANGFSGDEKLVQDILDRYNNPATRSAVQPMLDANGGIEQIEKLQQIEQQLGASLQEPDAQFNAWWNGVQSTAGTGAPLAALASVRNRAQQDLVTRTMASAGFALIANDQAQFNSLVDPTTGQPFTYTAIPGGFELQSPLVIKGKPVSLDFYTGQ